MRLSVQLHNATYSHSVWKCLRFPCIHETLTLGFFKTTSASRQTRSATDSRYKMWMTLGTSNCQDLSTVADVSLIYANTCVELEWVPALYIRFNAMVRQKFKACVIVNSSNKQTLWDCIYLFYPVNRSSMATYWAKLPNNGLKSSRTETVALSSL